MAEKKRVRWDCPTKSHPGALGPTRPPKDSVVRYCLPCSQERGRLVLRVAPALERKREAAAQASAAKARAKQAQEIRRLQRAKEAEDARYTVEGVDLREEMKRLLKLRAFGGKKGRLHKKPPALIISRRTTYPRSRLGSADLGRNRITVATYPDQTLADAKETLVHELTHIAVGRVFHQPWHGPSFRAIMKAAFKEAYGVAPVGIQTNSYHGQYAAALTVFEKANSDALCMPSRT